MTKSLLAAFILPFVLVPAAVAADSCCPSTSQAACKTGCPEGYTSRTDLAGKLLAKLNDYRKGKGLAEVKADADLSAAACKHACAIVSGKAPFSPQGLTAGALAGSGRAVGQIGRTKKSSDDSLGSVVTAWTTATSPLNGKVSAVGLAVVEKKGEGFTYAMISRD